MTTTRAGRRARGAPSSTFKATPSPSRTPQSNPSAPYLATQPSPSRMRSVSTRTSPLTSSGLRRIASATRRPASVEYNRAKVAAVRRVESRKGGPHPLQRHAVGWNTAPVRSGRHRVTVDVRGSRDQLENLLLAGVCWDPVPRYRLSALAAEEQHGRVLPRARVLQWSSASALEIGLRRARPREECADWLQLIWPVQVGGGGDRYLLIGEVGPRPHHREHLDRLGRAAEEGDEARIARRLHARAVPDGER